MWGARATHSQPSKTSCRGVALGAARAADTVWCSLLLAQTSRHGPRPRELYLDFGVVSPPGSRGGRHGEPGAKGRCGAAELRAVLRDRCSLAWTASVRRQPLWSWGPRGVTQTRGEAPEPPLFGGLAGRRAGGLQETGEPARVSATGHGFCDQHLRVPMGS